MWSATHPPQQRIEMVQEITSLNSSHLDLPSAKGNQGSKPRLASACGRARGVLLQLGNSESKISHLLLQGCEPFFGRKRWYAWRRCLRRDAAWMPFRDGVPRRRWRQAPLLMAVMATQCFPSEGISRQGCEPFFEMCLRSDVPGGGRLRR